MGFDRRDIKDFHSALTASAAGSIDEFLSHNKAMVMLGRAAIAQVLIWCEDSAHLKAAKDNWYWQLGWYSARVSGSISTHLPSLRSIMTAHLFDFSMMTSGAWLLSVLSITEES